MRPDAASGRCLSGTDFRTPTLSTAIGPFLAVAIRHGGRDVGNFFVAREQEGREFSREDEEILVMFFAQAALVIADACQRREEQRALARLETLVDTSPVGVVVFDATTGAPVSFNREARRLVDTLRTRASLQRTCWRSSLCCARTPGRTPWTKCPWRSF